MTEKYQWEDTELCMFLDKVTGKPKRFGDDMNSMGTLDEALKYCKAWEGWEDRFVIVKLNCIAAQ